MDKISKALELSRRTSAVHRPTSGRANVEAINYTRTRSIQLDRDYLAQNGVIEGINDKAAVDAYKLLRTRVMQRMRHNNWRTIGVTSALENEGKSLTSINLAISIAKKFNHTVALVDADLRRPSVHRQLGFDPELGISDFLKYDAPIEDILVHPGINRLVILPGREAVEGSSEYLASPKMEGLIQELRNRYPSRYVIVDLPPALLADDVVAFSPLLDTLLLVVEDERVNKSELRKTMELLEGVNLIGTVLTKARKGIHTHGYNYYR